MAFDSQMFGGGLGGLLGGLFGDSGGPYEKQMDQYQQYAGKAEGVQNPYLQAGNRALGDYQSWLQGQKDPSAFINNQMGQYQASPYSQYLQQQAMRAGQNAASANGLSGSTPMMQFMQQNAGNIASQDQNQWLQHVLGINTQYGQGQHNLVQGGQQSANALTNMYGDMGRQMGDAAYGKQAGENQDFWNTIGGALSMGASFL